MSRRFLRAQNVVPGFDNRVIADGVVEIDAGRIRAVGPAAEFGSAIRESSWVDDYGDSTILPGLIDAHAHLTFPADGRTYDEISRCTQEELHSTALRNVQLHAAGGVTTIRDNGAPGSAIFRARRSLPASRSPRLLLAGRPVTETSGHMHWCGGGADGPAAIRAEIRRLVAEGADHIKLVASGGGTVGTSPWAASYPEAHLKAAVDEASTAGLLTTAHCHAREAIANAVRAGVQCIEHATFLAPPKAGDPPPRRSGVATGGWEVEYDPLIVEEMVRHGTFVGFTFAGGYGAVRALEAKQRERDLTVAETEALQVSRGHVRRKIELFQRFLSDGLSDRLVISSDAGPGDNAFGMMWLNLDLAVQGGMGPIAAIEAATSRAADACGIAAETGSLRSGLAADVVVVDGNAVDDVTRAASVRLVLRNGHVLHSKEDDRVVP